MKKTYMKPQTAVYQMELSTLIAESLPVNGSKTLKSTDILTKGSGNSDIWGDDDNPNE